MACRSRSQGRAFPRWEVAESAGFAGPRPEPVANTRSQAPTKMTAAIILDFNIATSMDFQPFSDGSGGNKILRNRNETKLAFAGERSKRNIVPILICVFVKKFFC